ncbi:hypothetical protein [uncultured Mobiluncus sp.]|uniref:hypothetical protein n=1 Tax=uncultured Mobiluncus sp. TaxID=293425 RepID=UPI002621CD3E|nr:hypothetical protein [uncultured Mobiluncus sp.]
MELTEEEVKVKNKALGIMGAAGFKCEDPEIFNLAFRFARGEISEAELNQLVRDYVKDPLVA